MPIRTSVINKKLQDFVSAEIGSKKELVPWQYYSIVDVAGNANGQVNIPNEIVFFQQQKSALVTSEETNLPSPGKIGVPYRFLAQYLSVEPLPAIGEAEPVSELLVESTLTLGMQNDIAKLLSRGYCNLSLLDKDYVQIAPISALPAGGGAMVHGGIGALPTSTKAITMANVTNGWSALSNKFAIEVPLEGEQNFQVKIAFPRGVFAVLNSFRIKVALDGILQRIEQ